LKIPLSLPAVYAITDRKVSGVEDARYWLGFLKQIT
jgi:hypothetical protein